MKSRIIGKTNDNDFLLNESDIKNFKNEYEIKQNIRNKFINISPKLKYHQPIHYLEEQFKIFARNDLVSQDDEFCDAFLEHQKSLGKSIGKIDTYHTKINPRINLMNKMKSSNFILPNVKEKKNVKICDYVPAPHSGNFVYYAEPPKYIDQRSKSLGYINPIDHYFNYMSDEKQRPEHIVLPFPRGGYDTRHLNKSKIF